MLGDLGQRRALNNNKIFGFHTQVNVDSYYALIEIKLIERAGMSAVELLAHERIFNNCHRTTLAAAVAG
jgi:hypothetical protein